MSFLEPIAEGHEIILSALCNEPDGEVVREVRQLIFTPDNLYKLWNKIKQFPTLYGISVEDNPQILIDHFFTQDGLQVRANGLYFVIDDFVGLFSLDTIVPNLSANVHYSFFDRRHKGREFLIKEMLRWAFDKFNFQRVSTTIPVYVKPNVMKFVTDSLGFVYEGKMRRATYYKNKWWDINSYGLLREEL